MGERFAAKRAERVCVRGVAKVCAYKRFRMRGTQKGVHERVVCVCVEVSWRWSRGTAPEVVVL